MPTKTTEFASTGMRGMSAYESLAQRSGKSLGHIVELAAGGRLNELFDERGFVGTPRTPREVLRWLEACRHDPSVERPAPAELIGELRALRASWAIEAEEARRHRDPDWRLGEILAKRTPPWAR